MRTCDLIHGRISTLDVQRTDGERFPRLTEHSVEVLLVTSDRDDIKLCIGEEVYRVEGAAPRDREALSRLRLQPLPRLAWVVQQSPTNSTEDLLMIRVHELPASFEWDEPMEIGVDDKLVEDIRRKIQRLASVSDVVRWLTEEVLLVPRHGDDRPRALLSGTPSATNGARMAFRLYGDGYAADVIRGDDERLRVTRVVRDRRAKEGDEHHPIYLVTGAITFCDATVAGEFRGVAQTELDALVSQADSYLSLWQTYNERERESILRHAKEFEWISYSSCERRDDDTWSFELDIDEDERADLQQRIKELGDERLEASAEVSSLILGADPGGPSRSKRTPFTGNVAKLSWKPARLILEPASKGSGLRPPERGYLFMALGGDEVRIKRRQKAWEQVRGCTSPMPQLGLLLEGAPVPTQHVQRREPLSRGAREALPTPTDRQREALDVALNTPDIALIQGPPGTGKTRVITALQARLSEQDEVIDPHNLSRNTLLTSYQHDAVENVATATRVLGLPPVKVGRRSGEDEPRDAVEVWQEETAQEARARRDLARSFGDEPTVYVVLRRVRERIAAYISAPSSDGEEQPFLEEIADLASPWLPGPLADALSSMIAKLRHGGPVALEDKDRAFVLKAVRGLRVEAIPFGDDGPMSAHKVLRRLAKLEGFSLLEAERACLEQAADKGPGESASPHLLGELQKVRDALIDRLKPAPPDTRIPRARVEAEELAMQIINALDERARETAAGVDLAIEEWIEVLEHDPEGVRDAIQRYSMVLAATCQQSVSHRMYDVKSSEDLVFRNVIVDEAARANPLDLIIPMATAERRIVLVGDHRQLPHLLEPDIERELEVSIREETKDALKKSLFEKLFSELRARERKDGIKRTVTLDKQYRMHPVLGAFISEQFYEPHGEGFASGRPASDFEHQVSIAGTSLAGKVAAWLDVPVSRGKEDPGQSKQRRVEASVIASEAKKLLDANEELSVGVITFYAAQREAILQEMLHGGLTSKSDGERLRVSEQYERTRDNRERLRIGTVDAFQGKEFDVVFLSLTRSNSVTVQDERTRRRRYGFLLVESRLCVALSRQQRLLVVVGDAAMARGQDAQESIPGLAAFLKLCEGDHGEVINH